MLISAILPCWLVPSWRFLSWLRAWGLAAGWTAGEPEAPWAVLIKHLWRRPTFGEKVPQKKKHPKYQKVPVEDCSELWSQAALQAEDQRCHNYLSRTGPLGDYIRFTV